MGKLFPVKNANLEIRKKILKCNMMTYSELSDLCYTRKKSLTSVAECANMTLRGFREGMNKQTLSIKAVLPICRELGISPNDFFGCNDNVATYNTNQVGVVNSQNIGAAGIEILQQQLAIKDEQIMHLLQLLNK